MNAPPVQYARTSDGVNIAYLRLGTGPAVVWASNIYGDAFFYRKGWPYVTHFVDLIIAAGWQVILYDVRGMGQSDKPVARLDLDARVLDLEAVVRATALTRFVLAAADIACATAIAYAARHPDPVSSLLLIDPWASGLRKNALAPTRLAALMDSPSSDEWALWSNVLGSIVTGFQNAEMGQQLADAIQESTSPTQLAGYFRATWELDVVNLLPTVRAPALVTHFPNSAMGSLELAREVASELPDARFLVTESSKAWPAMLSFLQQGIPPLEAGPRRSRLSIRELAVLRLLAAGRSNQQIADELIISLNTVRRHVSNIFDKTGAANRAQATAYAKDHGLA